MADGNDKILFKKFEILECLKKDVGASVYCANHIYLGKRILLKTLDRDNIADPAMLSRFQREAKTLAKLDHPNIIKVLDFGTFEQFFYISFEYFESRNLREIFKLGELSESQKKSVLEQLLCGLDYAHSRFVIHRDIKPENILLDEINNLKIADFGLAQIHGEESLTQQSSIVGTPSYMSPEQIRGEELTVQSDLFSAGVVAYELFTGAHPFLGNDIGATLNNILSRKIDVEKEVLAPEAIRKTINALLLKNKTDRLPSANAALKILDSKAQFPTDGSEPKSPRISIGLIVGFFGVLVILSVFMWWMKNSQNSEKVREEAKQQEFLVDSAHVNTKADSMENISLLDTIEKKANGSERPVFQQASEGPESLTTPGRLYINCLPWATVYVDSKKVNTTPLESAIVLMPGDYEIQLKHPSYPTYVQNIRIESEKEYYITKTLYSYLVCHIYPWGEVLINGQMLGQTPFAEPLIIAPGTHVLTVENQEYGRCEYDFSIAAGDTFYFSYNFDQNTVHSQEP